MDAVFSQLLARQREAINALFFQARQYSHQLQPETVYRFLTDTLQPVVLAAAPHLPADELDQLALKLTVLALDLIGKQLLDPAGPFALIETAWRRLFAAHPQLLAESPRRAIAALSNALVHLCLHPGARPAIWVSELERLGGACPDLARYLKLGQILAWRVGLAQYRSGALALLPELPAQLQAELLENQPLAAWLASPWTDKLNHLSPKGLRMAAVTGRFSGWGGKLHDPPQLGWEDDALLVSDSQACWYVFRDAFGESWLRRNEPLTQPAGLGPWQLSPSGEVSYGEQQARFPELAGWSQAAGNHHTLAVAMPDSFRIRLIAAELRAP